MCEVIKDIEMAEVRDNLAPKWQSDERQEIYIALDYFSNYNMSKN